MSSTSGRQRAKSAQLLPEEATIMSWSSKALLCREQPTGWYGSRWKLHPAKRAGRISAWAWTPSSFPRARRSTISCFQTALYSAEATNDRRILWRSSTYPSQRLFRACEPIRGPRRWSSMHPMLCSRISSRSRMKSPTLERRLAASTQPRWCEGFTSANISGSRPRMASPQ